MTYLMGSGRGYLSGVGASGAPDPMVPADGTQNITGDLDVAGTLLMGGNTLDLSIAKDGGESIIASADSQVDYRAGSNVTNQLGFATVYNARIVIQPAVTTSGTITAQAIVGAAHTSLTNADNPDVLCDLSAVLQLDGNATVAEMKAFQVLARTYDAQAATLTLTDAATFYIDGPPVAADGDTVITNAWALWIDSGACRFDGDMQFGTHTGLGGESVSGYITIKDAAGNARKLAVVT